jgi:hypothetical protein
MVFVLGVQAICHYGESIKAIGNEVGIAPLPGQNSLRHMQQPC